MLPVANNTISAFRISSDPDVTNVSSERVILQEAAPQFNHNGGTIARPDGLYHGGNKNDPGPGYVVKEGNLTKIWAGFQAERFMYGNRKRSGSSGAAGKVLSILPEHNSLLQITLGFIKQSLFDNIK